MRPAVGAWWDRLLIGVLAAHVVVVFFHGPEWQQRWYLTMFGAISAAAGIALAIAVVVS